MLRQIHLGHLGIERCKSRAREVLFWPRMNQDITNVVAKCGICQKHQFQQPKEPMTEKDVPDYPWQRIASDLFELEKENYLVLVDYYSCYPEVMKLRETTSTAVINAMKTVFARHGVPELLVSDNGPQYRSAEFRRFAETWNFQHATSSPYYPKSNGLAENTVRTAKRLIKKAKEDQQNPLMSLLVHSSTPNALGYSPDQLLMGRQIRSNLPLPRRNHEPSRVEFKQRFQKKGAQQKRYYDQGSKHLPALHRGDQVRIKNQNTKKWSHDGVVTGQYGDHRRSYNIELPGGEIMRRNRSDILRTVVPDQTVQSEPVEPSDGGQVVSTPVTPRKDSTEDQPEPRRSLRTSVKTQRLIESI